MGQWMGIYNCTLYRKLGFLGMMEQAQVARLRELAQLDTDDVARMPPVGLDRDRVGERIIASKITTSAARKNSTTRSVCSVSASGCWESVE